MITLKLGDCLSLMKEIPNESIDAVITDPPYGIAFHSSWTDNHHKLENDESSRIYDELFPEAQRILKPSGVIVAFCGGGGAKPIPAEATMSMLKSFNLIQTLIWSKGKTDGSFVGLGWRYRPSYEVMIVGSKDKDNYAFYPEYSSNVFVHKPYIPQAGEHPTQKPVKLMRWLIANHTQEGDTVLDPFMGSGTTGVACVQMGRNFIGYEISPDYFRMAEKRISSASAQKKLMAIGD